MLPESLDQTECNQFGLDEYCLRQVVGGCCGVTVASHLPDIRKLRLCDSSLAAPPDPEDRIAVRRDEQNPVLHRPGEIIQVYLAEYCGHLPAGTGFVHSRPEAVHSRLQLVPRDFIIHD